VWHEHLFGDAPRGPDMGPRGSWVREASEVPFHPGLLDGPREPDRAGLFTVLIQRMGRSVSALRGRNLWVRLELQGDGRSTPEIAAVRAYGSRFSYIDEYLPELYRETLFGPDADAAGDATSSDFLERFLGTFESFLTPLEDRVAGAFALTDAALVPEGSIEWLASWIGAVVEPGDPPERRRVAIETAPKIHRRHGTLDGLQMALEVATGGDLRDELGAVRRGEVVVVEDYRLRRTFATILGAQLADADDPLGGGLAVSGNSFVGDTLFLGDESQREFLSLFDAELPSGAEERAIDAFFDALAHRATVVVHELASPEEVERIRRVAELEAPAHVIVRVAPGSGGLLVGIAALVGVDTYLVPERAPAPITLGRARLGGHHRLERPPSLDPRLGGGGPYDDARAPLAIPSDRAVELGDAFTLDGATSRAFSGRRVSRFRWTRNS
jgi:phage tail-like protein